MYLPKLNPRVLVLAASPLIFNRNNAQMRRNSEEFFEAPMPKALRAGGISRQLQLFLVERVYLYRYRRRQQGLRNGRFGNSRLDEFGFRSVKGHYGRREREYILSPRHPYQAIMKKFEFGGPSGEAFARILQIANERGLFVAVVNMPFRDEFLAISPAGREDYAEYCRRMAQLQAEYGFIWLDYQDEMNLQDGDFRDVDHLNANGAAKLSSQLASDLLNVAPHLRAGHAQHASW